MTCTFTPSTICTSRNLRIRRKFFGVCESQMLCDSERQVRSCNSTLRWTIAYDTLSVRLRITDFSEVDITKDWAELKMFSSFEKGGYDFYCLALPTTHAICVVNDRDFPTAHLYQPCTAWELAIMNLDIDYHPPEDGIADTIKNMTVEDNLTFEKWLFESGHEPGQTLAHLIVGPESEGWELKQMFVEPSLGGCWMLVVEYWKDAEKRFTQYEINTNIQDILATAGCMHFHLTVDSSTLQHVAHMHPYFNRVMNAVHHWEREGTAPPTSGISDITYFRWVESVLRHDLVTYDIS